MYQVGNTTQFSMSQIEHVEMSWKLVLFILNMKKLTAS